MLTKKKKKKVDMGKKRKEKGKQISAKHGRHIGEILAEIYGRKDQKSGKICS